MVPYGTCAKGMKSASLWQTCTRILVGSTSSFCWSLTMVSWSSGAKELEASVSTRLCLVSIGPSCACGFCCFLRGISQAIDAARPRTSHPSLIVRSHSSTGASENRPSPVAHRPFGRAQQTACFHKQTSVTIGVRA